MDRENKDVSSVESDVDEVVEKEMEEEENQIEIVKEVIEPLAEDETTVEAVIEENVTIEEKAVDVVDAGNTALETVDEDNTKSGDGTVVQIEPVPVADESLWKKFTGKIKSLSRAKKIGALLIIGLLGILFFIQTQHLDSVTLSESEITVNEGETARIAFVTHPSTANYEGEDLRWWTSNQDVATINGEGEIVAVSGGTCTVSLSWNGTVVDTCDVTVESVIPSLEEIYEKLEAPSYATLASDGSYLFIDTNPDDVDDFIDDSALVGIVMTHKLLELPESVINDMEQTRAMDGAQEYSNDDVTVKWRYHPNNGLEVTYSRR